MALPDLLHEHAPENYPKLPEPCFWPCQICRTSLLPSALKTLGSNKSAPLPVRLFEISDVLLRDSEAETGSRNSRRLVAICSSLESGFEAIHGLLNRIMDVLGVPLKGEEQMCI